MDYRFSVLIPVYSKEKPEYFSQSLNSVINQTLRPDEIVIVKDGPLTKKLDEVLDGIEKENPGLVKTVALPQPEGCGAALSVGINECSYELIARMDSDDISRNDRFEKQINEFKNDPALDICGSQIAEFEDNLKNIIAVRKVPLTDYFIKRRQKLRSAFNHVSVLYKKATIIKAGNYPNYPFMEDHVLWSRILKSEDVKAKNLDEYLVYVRIGNDMFRRRGGMRYFRHYEKGRRILYKNGDISLCEYILTIVLHLFVAFLPNYFRSTLYKKVLHRFTDNPNPCI